MSAPDPWFAELAAMPRATRLALIARADEAHLPHMAGALRRADRTILLLQAAAVRRLRAAAFRAAQEEANDGVQPD